MLSLLLALGIYGRVLLNSRLQVETLPTEIKAEVGALIAQPRKPCSHHFLWNIIEHSACEDEVPVGCTHEEAAGMYLCLLLHGSPLVGSGGGNAALSLRAIHRISASCQAPWKALAPTCVPSPKTQGEHQVASGCHKTSGH